MCFPSTWQMKNPYSCCCFLPKPHQFPSSPQPSLWFSWPTWGFAFMAITCFQKPVACLGLLSCLFATWSSSSCPSLCQRLQEALLTKVAGEVAVTIDWSVSLPLEGPLQPFCQFLPKSVKSSDQSKRRHPSPRLPDGSHRPLREIDWACILWYISSPPSVSSPVYC